MFKVLTLVPEKSKFTHQTQEHIANHSYTKEDIDILQNPRDLILTFSNARFHYHNGTRNGIDHLENGKLSDWFGTKENIYPRSDDQ